jgi:hypothetical protein
VVIDFPLGIAGEHDANAPAFSLEMLCAAAFAARKVSVSTRMLVVAKAPDKNLHRSRRGCRGAPLLPEGVLPMP